MISQYARLLRRRKVFFPFVFAVVARLPLAMAPLGMVVLIEDLRGSYASAGIVTGAFAWFTAVSPPLWGRVMDRWGQPLVIGATSTASSAFLAGIAAAAVGGASDPVLLVLAACAGLSFPPIAPAMRVAWRTVVADTAERRTAYAMDAVAVETIFVGGPLLLGVLLFAPAAVPLLVTACLMAVGGLAYSRTFAARSWRPEKPAGADGRSGRSPLAARGVLLTMLAGLGLAVGWGQMNVAITAAAEQIYRNESLLGLFFACAAAGSTVGGLWYGSRKWRRPERVHLPVTLAGFAAGLAAVMLVLNGGAHWAVLCAILAVAGVWQSPTNIVHQALVDTHAPPDRRGEAQGWLFAALTFGLAVGTAVAGFVVDYGGSPLAFGTAAATVAAGALVAVAAQRWWRADQQARSGEPAQPSAHIG
ncbi:MFS transporter [Streptomonospora sp. PA3]|uniref:MFS transporter n=1 Tax=Streptomonospora sp. PA3 TaxID=2607326 RepID=UPI00164315BD|nr:MFS transporter [Streptomonospora sp. PA3]